MHAPPFRLMGKTFDMLPVDIVSNTILRAVIAIALDRSIQVEIIQVSVKHVFMMTSFYVRV